VFHLVSCIPQNEMVVLAGDMNGHVGSSNVGYDGMHGGFGQEIGMQMDPGSMFMKQESQLVTYAAGPVKSTVDYIIVRQEDKAKVHKSRSYQSTNC